MASKQPIFQEEMLEALSFGASSVPIPFEGKVRFSYPQHLAVVRDPGHTILGR
jgi:hypothetical protein